MPFCSVVMVFRSRVWCGEGVFVKFLLNGCVMLLSDLLCSGAGAGAVHLLNRELSITYEMIPL